LRISLYTLPGQKNKRLDAAEEHGMERMIWLTLLDMGSIASVPARILICQMNQLGLLQKI